MKRPTNIRKIDIEFRCGEDPEAMLDRDGNKFCRQCQKTVIDFTQWTEEEIITFLERNKGNSCGMFGKKQLGQLNARLESSSPWTKHKIIASLIGGTLALSPMARGQNLPARGEVPISHELGHSISHLPEFSSGFVIAKKHVNPRPGSTLFFSGTILAEKDEPQEGISISVNSSNRKLAETISDSLGKFQLSLPQGTSLEKLSISIGKVGFDELVIPGVKIGNHDIKVFMARRKTLTTSLNKPSGEIIEVEGNVDSGYVFKGNLIDKETAEPLIGGIIRVYLNETLIGGAYTDLDGAYELRVDKERGEIGEIRLKFSYPGFNDSTISGFSNTVNYYQISLVSNDSFFVIQDKILDESSLFIQEKIAKGEFTPIIMGRVGIPRYPLHKRILRAPKKLWWGIRDIFQRI